MLITTAHFENAAPILTDLDLGLLLGARDRMEAGDTSAVSDFIAALAVGGKTKAFRKLAAIAGATVDELLEAETDSAKFLAREVAAAKRPFLDVFQEAMGFFSALVPTSPSGPVSLTPPAEDVTPAAPEVAESIPSAVS